jgi:CRISPR-associated protein Cmr2
MDESLFWQVKLAARIHDPAEKALVLLRDPAGHENGTSLALARLLGLFEPEGERIPPDEENALSAVLFRGGIPRDVFRIIQRADWWASAADRPQWPMQRVTVGGEAGKRQVFALADWARVRWNEHTALIHPLTGESFELPGGLSELEIGDVKRRSFEHFAHLVEKLGPRNEATRYWRQVALAFWRFGPELREVQDSGALGELWKLLPADTRVPDHSIWDHLDLVSAFAGAFAADADQEAALLAVSIGPVQGFIEQARKTDDLWAGSHLLARLAWEAIKPLCEELGPDAILFPRLRGVALVDLWLRDEIGIAPDLFEGLPWRGRAPDANPLFSAALPNRFLAVVPKSRAASLATACRENARRWFLELGLQVVDRLLEKAGFREKGTPRAETVPAYNQVRQQIACFPEVHWAIVPFSLVRPRNADKQTDLDVSALQSAMAPFYGVDPGEPAGFLQTNAWQVLSREIDWPDGTVFYRPNPGVLYPAVYELTERLLGAAKSVRPFEQTRQEGWRCTLTGEVEWLTTDRNHLSIPRGSRRSRQDAGFREDQHVETLWTRIADEEPSWARPGEHLGALAAIKRLWPTIFAEEVASETGSTGSRFVVSTHTMALAHQLAGWLQRVKSEDNIDSELKDELQRKRSGRVSLPRRLVYARQRGADDEKDPVLAAARQIPALLDEAREQGERAYARARKLVRRAFATEANQPEGPPLETYYGLLLMDGDRMGAILSGDPETSVPFVSTFHPQVAQAVQLRAKENEPLSNYLQERRPASPNRHMAISAALNDFSQIIVPHIVEELFPGRLIYAGGDDVMAMLPVADVLEAARRLRYAYSGELPEDRAADWNSLHRKRDLALKSGFALLGGRLMRMMGRQATASCGVVVAHHQAPLAFVLRRLREAEQSAKRYRRAGPGGRVCDRNAIHITLIKRSGGTLEISLDWDEPLELLVRMRDFLARPDVSRRAVYHTLEWLAHLPATGGNLDGGMLRSLLAYQLARQAERGARQSVDELAAGLAEQAVRQADARRWLENFLSVAEFLAREQRFGGSR